MTRTSLNSRRGRGLQAIAAGSLVALLLAATTAGAAVVDRIAAIVDHHVITLSEIDQMERIRFFPKPAGDDDYRRSILEALIAQELRSRDVVERFGAQEIPEASIDARVSEIAARVGSQAALDAALAKAELSTGELRALVKRQLQVEAYIQERFAPLVFVSNEDIATYYETTWKAQRIRQGLAVPALAEVHEQIRAQMKSSRLREEIDKWTTQLRARANVDVFAWR